MMLLNLLSLVFNENVHFDPSSLQAKNDVLIIILGVLLDTFKWVLFYFFIRPVYGR